MILINSQRKAARDEGRKKQGNYKTVRKNNMTSVSSYLSIITLKVNGLNSPNKIHRVAEWM